MGGLLGSTSSSSTGSSKRALLIGSPLGLNAIDNDLEAMDQVLRKHGFMSEKCCRPGQFVHSATRQGILKALSNLINQTSTNDQVVVYFTGHGCITERDEAITNDNNSRWRLQYIVPLDFLKTTTNAFRGITDIELSNQLFLLTKKTKNVTLILDCCHSSRVARAGSIVKAIDPDQYPEVSEHIQQMINRQEIGNDFYPEGNPNVVRIVAAAASESAFEQNIGGKRRSVLTEALEEALECAAASKLPVSWKRIMLHVQDRILKTCPQQHPQVEGPFRRFCFRLDEEDPIGGIPVSSGAAGLRLRGGHIHGVSVNDKYAIMPFDAGAVVPDQQIADAVVVAVGVSEAEIKVSWKNSHQNLPERGAQAILVKRALRQFPVLVEGDEDFCKTVSGYLRDSKYLHISSVSDRGTHLATVRREGTGMNLENGSQARIRTWSNIYDTEIDDYLAKSVVVLESLAKAQHVMALTGSPLGDWPLRDVSVGFGIVKLGNRTPFTRPGDVLYEGQSVYIDILNQGTRHLYISVFDVCLETVTFVTESCPSGIELPPGRSECLGTDISGHLSGLEVHWPDDVPKDGQITVTVVLVVSDDPIDLRSLESGPGQTARKRCGECDGAGTILMEIVDQIASGGDRVDRVMSKVMSKATMKHLQFGTLQLQYQLVPIQH